MDHRRYVRWVKASKVLEKARPYMLVVAQGLGRLDAKLISEDARPTQAPGDPVAATAEGLRLMDHLTLSYLWVLGAYELVRTIDQRCREDPSLFPPPTKAQLTSLKHLFERLRIPLAKMEPAKRYRQTDGPIAFPAIHQTRGLAWQVSSDHFIPRRDLSDALLAFLEQASTQ
jgi:hypothetical protein